MMQNTARMSALQTKGAGAPPAEPPAAPPMAEGAGEMGGGMPPPEQAIPQIAELLSMLAEQLPDEQKSVVMECATKLQSVFTSNPTNDSGMSQEDAEAYGEA